MTNQKLPAVIAVLLGLFGLLGNNMAASDQQLAQPQATSIQMGARIFTTRCATCHGHDAMGNGLVPLTVGDYPPTNLLTPRFGTSEEALKAAILWGGSQGDMSPLSPPWANELTWQEVESTLLFLKLLHSDTEQALNMLRRETDKLPASKKLGQRIYHTRCTLCHGQYGEGDGKMAKMITDPPPYNLRKSQRQDHYLRQIIELGGSAMNRSQQMPPWKDELTSAEITSIILYIKTLRDEPSLSINTKDALQ